MTSPCDGTPVAAAFAGAAAAAAFAVAASAGSSGVVERHLRRGGVGLVWSPTQRTVSPSAYSCSALNVSF